MRAIAPVSPPIAAARRPAAQGRRREAHGCGLRRAEAARRRIGETPVKLPEGRRVAPASPRICAAIHRSGQALSSAATDARG